MASSGLRIELTTVFTASRRAALLRYGGLNIMHYVYVLFMFLHALFLLRPNILPHSPSSRKRFYNFT